VSCSASTVENSLIIKRLNHFESELALIVVKNIKLKDNPNAQNNLTIEYMREFLSNDRNYVFVAMENGLTVGLLYAYRLQRIDRKQDSMFLYEIEVVEKYRSQGVGSALVEELKDICRNENIMKMWVVTNRSNEPAMRLYAKTGGDESIGGSDQVSFTYFPPYK
jgi:ribosomal protein S18 acetylase RimI-like enzyme